MNADAAQSLTLRPAPELVRELADDHNRVDEACDAVTAYIRFEPYISQELRTHLAVLVEAAVRGSLGIVA